MYKKVQIFYGRESHKRNGNGKNESIIKERQDLKLNLRERNKGFWDVWIIQWPTKSNQLLDVIKVISLQLKQML